MRAEPRLLFAGDGDEIMSRATESVAAINRQLPGVNAAGVLLRTSTPPTLNILLPLLLLPILILLLLPSFSSASPSSSSV